MAPWCGRRRGRAVGVCSGACAGCAAAGAGGGCDVVGGAPACAVAGNGRGRSEGGPPIGARDGVCLTWRASHPLGHGAGAAASTQGLFYAVTVGLRALPHTRAVVPPPWRHAGLLSDTIVTESLPEL